MNRLQRMKVVYGAIQDEERQQAVLLSDCARRKVDAGQRQQELQRYRADYARAFDQRALQGISAVALRDYQGFLARLDGAIVQQAQVVLRADAEEECQRSRWQECALRLKAVGTVLEKWAVDLRAQGERLAQAQTDERAALQMQRFAPDETLPGVQHDA